MTKSKGIAVNVYIDLTPAKDSLGRALGFKFYCSIEPNGNGKPYVITHILDNNITSVKKFDRINGLWTSLIDRYKNGKIAELNFYAHRKNLTLFELLAQEVKSKKDGAIKNYCVIAESLVYDTVSKKNKERKNKF